VGLAGADVELPAVPRAAQDLALARVDVFPRLGRLQQPGQHAVAQAAALMRAAVEQAEILAADVEDRDRPTLHRDQLARARRDLAGWRHRMPRHLRLAVQRLRVAEEELPPLLFGD